jgi:diguanylate cyclase (GGDEF)-like protein
VASFGWGSFFSFILHFILLYTKQRKILSKKVTYLVLYLPVAFNCFVFGINTKTTEMIYDLICSDFGWINISEFTAYDWAYNLYYACFSIFGLVLLIQWGIRSKDNRNLKQTVLISVTYIATFVMGTITEFVANIYLSVHLPQLGPVLILIPMSVMFYCILNYGFLVPEWVKNEPEINPERGDSVRKRLYRNLTRAYIIGGFVNFAAQYFTDREPLYSALAFSMSMVFVGMLIQFIQNTNISANYRNITSNLLMAISIPTMLLKYYKYSSVYAWVIPVIFILIAVAFSKRKMLILIVFSTLGSMIYLWWKYPITIIHFNGVDHLIRIIVLGIILWIAFYINHIYQERIKENEERARHQSFLIKVSTMLLTANEKNFNECMDTTLEICSRYLKADRIYISLFEDDSSCKIIYERCKEGIPSAKEELLSADWSRGINLVHKLGDKTSEAVCVYDFSTLVEDNHSLSWLHSKPIKSMAVNPMVINDAIVGYLVLESVHEFQECKENQKETITLLTHMISNIWNNMKAEKRLSYKAYYDDLTGLPNRASIMEKLGQLTELKKDLFGVIFFDIDNFKSFNEIMGHEGGNQLILEMSNRLREKVVGNDALARISGDTFVFLIEKATSKEDILERCHNVMDEFQTPVMVYDQNFYISISLGLSFYPSNGVTPEELLKNAEIAMQHSKENGRNKYTVFSQTMKSESITNSILINDLHLAIEREEFELHYQPQVNLATKEIIGVEALIRWQHPEKGIIMPGVFIPLAEKTGLIVKIGKWVLTEACRQCVEWQNRGGRPIRMAINMSLGQFLDPKLASDLQEVITITGVNPNLLELEITESIAAFDQDQITRTLFKLKKFGVKISIDDFGTEYSSLSRIKTMPIDKIKIDQRFIRGISANNKDEEIIKVILQMGKIFGLKVIAEGVETEKELAFLESNCCDEVQGFYFYRPLTTTDLEALLFL